jgi:cell division protein FtsB
MPNYRSLGGFVRGALFLLIAALLLAFTIQTHFKANAEEKLAASQQAKYAQMTDELSSLQKRINDAYSDENIKKYAREHGFVTSEETVYRISSQ